MHGFSIDFLTGNTPAPSSYDSPEFEPQAKQKHDIPVTTATYYPPVHLDDVYSVINNDVAVCSTTTGMTSSIQLPTTLHCDADLERGTPSPNRDSGIESDHSPGHVTPVSPESIEKTLSKLETTAAAVKTKPSTASNKDKPGHSYLTLIARAILASRKRKLTLSDIYRHIMENNPYYDNGEKAWRGSIRYTLSINECFIKDGKEETGKGNFWAIHPACVEDFEKGDYRRRQARRRAKRSIKTVSSYSSQTPMTTHNAAYTPMTSAYVYSPYGTGQSTYPYSYQNYGYDYTKPEPEPAATTPQSSTTSANQAPHPAFGYPNYSAYGYMYQNYSAAAETAYRHEMEKWQQQYDTVADKKWAVTSEQSESSTARGLSPSEGVLSPTGSDRSCNEIHIL